MGQVKLWCECAREHAEIWEGLLAGLDDSAVVGQEALSTANGQDLTSGSTARVVAYLSDAPAPTALAELQALGIALSGQAVSIHTQVLADVDWASVSQQGLARVRVGRVLLHSAEDDAPKPPGLARVQVRAANAFGTGHHGTTFGCLDALQHLVRRTPPQVRECTRIADVGCGTAVLAFAAGRLYRPAVPIVATDIDARAIKTARVNAAENALARRVRFAVAQDVRHRLYRRRVYGFGGTVDLAFANILSGLLVDMAPRLSGAVRPGGRLVLAGLLAAHTTTVARAYELLGYRIERRVVVDGWGILTLVRVRVRIARQQTRGHQRFHRAKGGQWMRW